MSLLLVGNRARSVWIRTAGSGLISRRVAVRSYTQSTVHGERRLITADIQRFLDEMQPVHPEVARWSHSTRVRLSRHALATMRDFGLLQGKVSKQIVEPIVPPVVVLHLIRLLQAEGIPPEQVAQHPDWQLWLWDAARAQKAIDASQLQERAV